jgi:hypothetical protein
MRRPSRAITPFLYAVGDAESDYSFSDRPFELSGDTGFHRWLIRVTADHICRPPFEAEHGYGTGNQFHWPTLALTLHQALWLAPDG